MNEENEYARKLRETTRKLLETTESKSVTEMMVKFVYGEDFSLPYRMLDTKIEASGKEVLELAGAIEKIESYDDFRGRDVAEGVRYLHDKGYIMSAKFGREMSPVLYIEPPYWNSQASNYARENDKPENHYKYSELERNFTYGEIERTLSRCDPDELDRTEYYGVRAWWD